VAALLQNAHAWGFVCGRIAVLERSILGSDFYQTLLAQHRPEDILRQLQETSLREAVTAAGDWEDWSATIDQHFYNQVASIRKDCPDTRIPDLFLLQGDYQNLKRALIGQRLYPFHHAVLTPELLNAAANADFMALPIPFRGAAQAGSLALEKGEITGLDPILDGCYLRHLLLSANEIKVPHITEYYETLVLSRILVFLWRGMRTRGLSRAASEHLLPMGSLTETARALINTEDSKNWADVLPTALSRLVSEHAESTSNSSPQQFELAVDNMLFDHARRGQGQVSGPERVFSFLCALATEAYNLKLAVCGRLSRIDGDMLKPRLRRTHA